MSFRQQQNHYVGRQYQNVNQNAFFRNIIQKDIISSSLITFLSDDIDLYPIRVIHWN